MTIKTNNKIKDYGLTFGCDPEFFFSKDGNVVSSDTALPKDGLVGHRSCIVIDGVQAELNPPASFCRQILGSNIASSFRLLENHIKKQKLEIDFKQTIELTDKDMRNLSEKAKKFGCAPSKNTYNKRSRITVNPEIYKYRSAGGHIHIGHNGSLPVIAALRTPTHIVQMLDLIVGNTCVLIDRDPSNRQRRKVYGKAGEYRLPQYGIEYRTLSNFWLKSYQLMSLVMGLSRVAVLIASQKRDKELLKLVDMKEVRTAINQNDFKLALKNYKKIEKTLYTMIPNRNEHFDITTKNYVLFRYFIKKGLDHWFRENPVKHWTSIDSAMCEYGFGEFLDIVVKGDYENSRKCHAKI